MIAIKCFGLALIVVSSALVGIFKSRSLVQRYKKLSLLSDGINTLYDYIQQGEFELKSAVKNAFLKCSFLKFTGNSILCDDDDLQKDKRLIEEFFSTLGNSTKKIECDRINHFKLKLKSQIKEAENDMIQKRKIYQMMGICVGLIIGILLI